MNAVTTSEAGTIDPLSWINDELATLDALSLRRELRARCGAQGPTVEVEGRTLLNFGANDYLGLAADPSIVEAAAAGLQAEGLGSGASPLVTGRSRLHEQLERHLAEFEGAEAALLFPTGFAANVGAITALAGRGDVIFSDEKNHASIIDGCRLSGARVQVYPHGRGAYLKHMLQQAGSFRRRLIVTDSLFSMDGDLAPLAEISDLAEAHQAMLMVDEAHATGVFGERGRGVCEELGVEDRVHVRVGTLSKALGALGGFVVGSRPLIDWLANRARTYVFSTAAPPALAAAGIAALRIVESQPERRRSLRARSEKLAVELQSRGWDIGNSASHIIPVALGDAELTMNFARRLQDRGLLIPGIRPPSVPEGEALLRISLCYGHTEEMIGNLVQALDEVRGQLSVALR